MRALFVTLFALSACRGEEMPFQTEDERAEPPLTETGVDPEFDGALSGDEAVVTWWSMDGALAFQDGAPDAAASTLTLAYWDANATSLCSQEEIPVEWVSLEPPADSGLSAWWQLRLDLSDSACEEAGASGEDSFFLGLGPMDARLEAAAEANDLDASLPNLWSLYLQSSDGEPLYLFGVAGTEAMFQGAPAALPTDEALSLRTLYLLPYLAEADDVATR